jgi:flavin-dependent dehydrogenase
MSREFHVIVVGGGPAGCAAATVLARRGRRVLLLHDAAGRDVRIGEALPPAANPLLRDLGLLDWVGADGHLPCYGNASAWGSEELISTDFVFNPHGHGWHLDRAVFDTSLRFAARDAGATVMSDTRFLRADRGDDGRWRVSLASEGRDAQVVRSEWLVDATGRRATVARGLGVARQRHDRLIAFHARFRAPTGSTDRDSRTLIEAGPGGWWYSALVPGGIRVAVFQTDSDLEDRSGLLTPAGFKARIEETRHVSGLLSGHGYLLTDRPRVTDASSARLEGFAGPGWLAAGDAALSFDPLSSQGIMTALYSGLRAGQAIDRCLDGDAGAVDEYAARIESIHQAYRRNLAAHYSLEWRSPQQSFWQRRHMGSDLLAAEASRAAGVSPSRG